MSSIIPEVERRLSTLEAFRRVDTAVSSARAAAEEEAKRKEEEERRIGSTQLNENSRSDGRINNTFSRVSNISTGGEQRSSLSSGSSGVLTPLSSSSSTNNRTTNNRISTIGRTALTTASSRVGTISPNESSATVARSPLQSSSLNISRIPSLLEAQRTAQNQLSSRQPLSVLV